MIIFENIELFILSIIVVIMSSLAVILSVRSYLKYSSIEKRYDLFMSGRDAESLEQFFLDIQSAVDHLMDDNKRFKEQIRELRRLSKISYQKIGIQRYDAFEEKTGKRSFAFCMLDFTNTGFIATCQNTGNGTLIFIKEVDAGVTSIKLGPEEEKALNVAMAQEEKSID